MAMAALFASGRIIDLILAFTVLEAVALMWWHRRSGRGPPAGAIFGNILAGMCLLLALRVALTGGWWGWTALALLAALLAHAFDLSQRWVA